MVFTLNKDEQKHCIHIVRTAIQSKLSSKPLATLTDTPDNLSKIQGVFVTLTINKRLRGCIGNIIGQYPLNQGIKKMAVQAAFHDPRFMPLREDELDRLDIEISVLSPLIDINHEDVEVGKHGLLIKYQYSSGVLLPQVPVEQNWNKKEYLDGLCQKAGIARNSYLQADCKLQAFTAFVFGEET